MVEKEKQQMYRVINPNRDLEVERQMFQDPESKTYLVCLYIDDNYDGRKIWEILIGRHAVYEYIKSEIADDDANLINPLQSFVLVESCKLSERISVYAFMKHAQDIFNDGYDIEDDYPNIHENNNEVDPKYPVDERMFSEEIRNSSLSMKELMDQANGY